MIEWESSLWIVLSSLLFGVFHSITASQSCKRWVYKHGLKEPHYRLFYSLLALLSTAVWVGFVHQLSDMPLYQSSGVLYFSLCGVQVLGTIVALAAFQPIDGLVFLGLRKADDGMDPFIVRGIYRILRHPMYAGVMLLIVAMPEQSSNGLVFALMVCAYFIIGSHFEEQRMLAEHPEYADYQAKVPAFIPWFNHKYR